MATDLALVPIDAEHEDEPTAMERTSTFTSGNGSARRRGKYCCVPHCTNEYYKPEGQPAEISFCKFPNDKNKKLWLTAIKRQKNKHPVLITGRLRMLLLFVRNISKLKS